MDVNNMTVALLTIKAQHLTLLFISYFLATYLSVSDIFYLLKVNTFGNSETDALTISLSTSMFKFYEIMGKPFFSQYISCQIFIGPTNQLDSLVNSDKSFISSYLYSFSSCSTSQIINHINMVKILSVIAFNKFLVQSSQGKVFTVGDGPDEFLTTTNNKISQSELALYRRQLQHIGKEAQWSTKQPNSLIYNQIELIEKIDPEDQIEINFINTEEFVKTMRLKEIVAQLVSVERNTLNLIYEGQLLNVIPSHIYIDDYGVLDGGFTKFIQKSFLNKDFQIKIRGSQQIQAYLKGQFTPVTVLKVDFLDSDIYIQATQQGYAYLTDYGTLSLPRELFSKLFQIQEQSKQQKLGLWRNGELDRRLLNSISAQIYGTVVKVIEANHFLLKTDAGNLDIKLDRICIEGLEAKEFARRLLIGKQVNVLQLGEANPCFTMQLIESGRNVEEELIANGWALIKDSHPQLSKFKLQIFQQLNQQAKHKKLGQYSQDASWRIEDQTEIKNAKFVSENIWGSFLSDQQEKLHQYQSGFVQNDDFVIEAVVDSILPNNNFHIMCYQYKSIINLQLTNILSLSEFANSLPDIANYEKQRFDFQNDNILQRTVYVKFQGFNQITNTIRGQLFTKKNVPESDFVIELLSQGLAVQADQVINTQYEQAQEKAKKEKKGVWSQPYACNLLDMRLKEGKQTKVKESNIIKQTDSKVQFVTVSEIIDCREFYVRALESQEFEKIGSIIEKQKDLQPLKKPVQKGTLCLARFSFDQLLYRAIIIKPMKDNRFQVRFIDYGNEDEVNYEDLGLIPPELAAFPKQAILSGIAYLRLPFSTHGYAQEAAEQIRSLIFDQELSAKVAYTDKQGLKQYLVLAYPDQDIEKIEDTINAKMLAQGIGRVEEKILYNPYKQLLHLQEEALANQLGFWMDDDHLDDQFKYRSEYSD
ncbi:hypothetical protein pb186bvf_015339 [Paramecium bursaria]